MKNLQFIINHGWDASPTSNWFPWLKEELMKKGASVVVPEMPNAALPQVEEWVATLKSVVSPSHNNFFIGHSLGCISIVHFLSRYASEINSAGCVFVAGFSGNIDNAATANFYKTEIDFDQLISGAGDMTAIFSKDDEVVPLDRARRFAENLKAKEVVVDGYGHFVGSKGVTELPLVLDEIDRILAS